MAVQVLVWGKEGQQSREQTLVDILNILSDEGAVEIIGPEAPGTIYELQKGEPGCSVYMAEILPGHLKDGRTYGFSLDIIGSSALSGEDNELVRALRDGLTGPEVKVGQLPQQPIWSLPVVYDAASLPK